MAANPNEVLPRDEGAETFPVEPPTPIEPVLPADSGGSPTASLTDAFNMPNLQAEAFARTEELKRERASNWESIKAGADLWAVNDINRYIQKPDFAPGDLNVADAVLAVPFQLSDTEREFLMDNKSRSLEEHNYLLEQIETDRARSKVLGDNPVFGMVTAMLDPVWLGVGLASGGVGSAARFANLTWKARAAMSAGVEAGAAFGINSMIAEVRPMSVKEMVIDAMLGGGIAIATTSRSLGRIVPVDPDFPSRELNAFTRTMVPENMTTATVVRPKYEPNGTLIVRKDGSVVYETIADTNRRLESEKAARIAKEMERLPKYEMPAADHIPKPKGVTLKTTARGAIDSALAKVQDPKARLFLQQLADRLGPALDDLPVYQAKPPKGKNYLGYYDPGRHEVVVTKSFEDDPWTLAHEIMHGATYHKLRYGKSNPNTTHGRIVKDLEDIYVRAKKAAGQNPRSTFYEKYFTSNLDEFMAGLFTGDKDFEALLRSIDMPDGLSALKAFVDKIRELLGIPTSETSAFLKAMGLADDLMREPLRINFAGRGGEEIVQLPANPTRTELEREATRSNDVLWNATRGMRGSALAAAEGISWNFHKTLAKFDRRIADLLLDDPLRQSNDSADSWARSIRAKFTAKQRVFEDNIRDILSQRGIRFTDYIFNPQKVVEAQRQINMQLMDELDYRATAHFQTGQAARGGRGIPPEIVRLADSWEESTKAVIDEMRRSGVYGADEVAEHPGYFPRHWSTAKISKIERRLEDAGLTDKEARAALRDGLKDALLDRNRDWSDELAQDVATAILDRARRKGDFNDQTFRHHVGNEGLAVMRDELTKAGLDARRIQRVLDVFSGKVDETNKFSRLKSRVDVDGHFSISLPDGTTIKAHDLFETDLVNSLEHYMDDAAGRSAFARVGVKTESDFGKLHDEFISKVPDDQKKQFSELFHNAVDLIHGRPVGKNFSAGLRFMQAATQMVGLGSSGMWQLTEYAKLMQRYGVRKVLKHMRKSFRSNADLRNMSAEEAGRLEDILARNAFQDIRLRPMLHKLEDGWDLPTGSNVNLALQRAKQLVPYINAMKFVHHHQSNLVGSLIADTLYDAARGNAKSLEMLRKYGIDLDSPLMGDVRRDIATHGADTTRWSDGTFDAVRTGLDRMMDDAVLRSRKGELPAFAQVNDAGKFIFTFRSFMLGAHNKTLAGTMSRDGWAGLSLLLMYQYPMSIAAVQLNALKNGQELEDDQIAKRALALMGGIGMFSELVSVLTGESREFGAPGLIALDRVYRLLGTAARAADPDSKTDGGDVTAAFLGALPLISILPLTKAFQENLKE